MIMIAGGNHTLMYGRMVTYEALQTMIEFATLILAIITIILANIRKD